MKRSIPELPERPQRGEIRFFLRLDEIENMTAWEALKIAEDLGFTPQLHYHNAPFRGELRKELVAVLFQEFGDYERPLAPDLFDNEIQSLASAIVPNSAIGFTLKLKEIDELAAQPPSSEFLEWKASLVPA